MAYLANLVGVSTTTFGTGAVTLGAALPNLLTFVQAGVPDGSVVTYAIRNGVNSEVGRGVYSAGSLSRDWVIASTNGNALVNLFATSEVRLVSLAEDFVDCSPAQNVIVNGGFDVWQRGTASLSSAAATKTFLADRWYVQPTGAAVTQAQVANDRSGARSRYLLQVTGDASVTTVLIGQKIIADEVPAVKRKVTFQAWIYNGTGTFFTPDLLIGTPGSVDVFTSVTNRLTQNLQMCLSGVWTLVYFTVDVSAYTNVD